VGAEVMAVVGILVVGEEVGVWVSPKMVGVFVRGVEVGICVVGAEVPSASKTMRRDKTREIIFKCLGQSYLVQIN